MTIEQLTSIPTGTDGIEIIEGSRNLAAIQSNHGVHVLFRPSWTDTETGRHGIRWLIYRILSEAGAYVSLTNSREELIKISLFTDEIIKKVREYYTADKYPDHTIIHNLSYVMKGQVGKIQLTGAEDIGRTCRRPRCKWYLLANPLDTALDTEVNLS